MEFACKTVYDRSAQEAMSLALRKTMRKKMEWYRWLIFLGLTVLALGTVMDSSQSVWRRGAYLTVVFLILFLQWKGDCLNALFAMRKTLPGAEVYQAHFYPDYYERENNGVVIRWEYSKILALAETKRYVIFVLGKNHAQAYAKAGLSGRDAEKFCGFLSRKTGLAVQQFRR